MRRPCLALAALLSAGAIHAANADPLLECAVMVGQTGDLNACLSAQLEVSYGAMNEALALARARAEALDSAAGGDAAVLGIEASQQAFEAWRDTACQTEAIFAGGDAAADNVELACEIALTRTRSDMLVRLSAPRAG
jgi:uncharacterized protein YecT (DUF1311 family)